MFVSRVHGFCHDYFACPRKLIRLLRSSANAGYSKINSLRVGSLFLGPLAAPPPKFLPELAQVSLLAGYRMLRPLRTTAETSLVPSSLLPRCPREVWERAGEYFSVTTQLKIESRIDRAENA